MAALFALPLIALLWASSPAELLAGVRDPSFASALTTSLTTSAWALMATVVLGTPLAWWLAASRSRLARWVETFVELPVVLPPAVVGLALLWTFGRQGLLGAPLNALGLSIPFTGVAVVIAQIVVAAPLFVRASSSAFRSVDAEALVVARTLGASPFEAFRHVAWPLARPGLLAGAALAWARALGEFGATLLFAGNLPGRTQTMPLAIYGALESDVRVALALSCLLALVAIVVLAILRRLGGLDGAGPKRGPARGPARGPTQGETRP